MCIFFGDSCFFCVVYNHDNHDNNNNHDNDEMSFEPLSTDFSHIKIMAVLYLMAVCSGTVIYAAGGLRKGTDASRID